MLAHFIPPIVAVSPSKSICIKLAYRLVSEMASKVSILLLVNLLFFALVSSGHSWNCGRGDPSIPGTGDGGGSSGGDGGNGNGGDGGGSSGGDGNGGGSSGGRGGNGNGGSGGGSNGGSGIGNGGGNGGGGNGGGGGIVRCPINILQLGVCANILGGVIGISPPRPCCSLLGGLTDLEAAVCLCAAIRANILGIILDVDLALRLILITCGKNRPAGFIC